MSEQDHTSPDQAPVVDNAPPSPSTEASSGATEAAAAETVSVGGKADLGKRAMALIIDVVLVFIVGFVPAIGGLVGAAYMLLRDGMDLDFMNHRSIGKNVMKLRVDSLTDAPIDPLTSIKRNWLFAFGPLAQAAAFIPIIGWLFAILMIPLALLAFLVEVVLVLTDSEGRRVGDKIADTVVRED